MSREVPDGWKLTAFSNIATDVSAKNRSRNEIPVLSVTKYDGFVPSVEYFKKKVFSADTENYKIVRKGQFAYATIHLDEGSIDRLTRLDVGLISPMYTVFEINERHADPDFILRLFKFYATNGRFDALGNGGVNRRKSISFSTLGKLSIPLPPLHEQRRIAEILSSVDEAIAATRAVIEQTRKVKQGVLERLLTKGIGHTRFKQTEIGEIPEGWEVVQISNLAASIDSGWSPDCEKVAAAEGEWGILKTSAVVWDGYKSHENKKLPRNLAPRPEIEVKAGDVLITRAGPVDRTGVVALVKNTQRKLMLSDKIIRIQTDAELCIPGFLSLWLSSPSAQNEIIKKKSGMAQSQTNISQKALRELCVSLPPLHEQIQIADAVESVDDCISAESAKLDAFVVAKSALMSDLLTGRKRVTDALPLAAE